FHRPVRRADDQRERPPDRPVVLREAHEHGGNIQALSAPNGFPLWVCDVEPGSTHNLTAAREHVLGTLYWAPSQLDLPTSADAAYEGPGIGVHTPVKQPPDGQVLDPNQPPHLQRPAARPALPG